MKTLDSFDFFAADGGVSRAQISELARGEWVGSAENIIFAGPRKRRKRLEATSHRF